MTTYLQDSFNRANGAVGTPDAGGPYIDTTNWAISGNVLANTAVTQKLLAAAATNVDISATCTLASGITGWGMVLRYTDANNFLQVGGLTSGYQIIRSVGGASSTISVPGSGGLVSGATYRLIANGNNVDFYSNGVRQFSFEDSMSGTIAGVAHGNSTSNVRTDNLLIQTLPTDPSLGFPTTAATYLGRDTKILDTGAA